MQTINPSEIKINKITETMCLGEFSIEPLPNGYGNTLGNALRRVLLTSLEGSAITQVKFSGADHQFTVLPGVKEDIVELTLNLKRVRLAKHAPETIIATIEKKGPGTVTAADIDVTSEVEILNKDLVIATLADKNAVLKAELTIETGTGYSPMEERQTTKIGNIVLDALYSPILRVGYSIEPTRYGTSVNLDKLNMTVETDGSIAPSKAVEKSAEILKNYFTRLATFENTEAQEDQDAGNVMLSSNVVSSAKVEAVSVDELPLPTRTINALKKQNIETLAQLAKMSGEELADIKNLGEKSLNEIKKLLKKEGLSE